MNIKSRLRVSLSIVDLSALPKRGGYFDRVAEMISDEGLSYVDYPIVGACVFVIFEIEAMKPVIDLTCIEQTRGEDEMENFSDDYGYLEVWLENVTASFFDPEW